MARRRKPTDPLTYQRREAEKVEREAEKRRLASIGATFTVDSIGRVRAAWRSSVLQLLRQSKAITESHYDAGQKLTEEWAMWKGKDGGSDRQSEHVDGSSGSAELVTDRMIKAGKRVALVFAQLTHTESLLLTAFMVAMVEEDRPMVWRAIVSRTIGETDKARQTTAVVGALESLRRIYQEPKRIAA